MKNNEIDIFLSLCKTLYIDKAGPSDPMTTNNPAYHKIVNLSELMFKNEEYEMFATLFQEGHYFVGLWAAHMLLEFGDPPADIKLKAIKIIESYSENELAPEVAAQEKIWLLNYKLKNCNSI
jgi:hypothetical protein